MIIKKYSVLFASIGFLSFGIYIDAQGSDRLNRAYEIRNNHDELEELREQAISELKEIRSEFTGRDALMSNAPVDIVREKIRIEEARLIIEEIQTLTQLIING